MLSGHVRERFVGDFNYLTERVMLKIGSTSFILVWKAWLIVALKRWLIVATGLPRFLK